MLPCRDRSSMFQAVEERVLREFGDYGADTLRRYFAQIEYTAFLCIRMLGEPDRISAVVPETLEDVQVEHSLGVELHQTKTRAESRPPWTWPELVPVLAKLFSARRAAIVSTYVFVSNHLADSKSPMGKFRNVGISPFRFKMLLAALSDHGDLTNAESEDLERAIDALIPHIQDAMHMRHGDSCEADEARVLLRLCRLETDSERLKKPSSSSEFDGRNVAELAATMSDASGLPVTVDDARMNYSRLLLLILRKILTGRSSAQRRISRDDVLSCRQESSSTNLPDLASITGGTVLHKKAVLGGFDPTEVPTFRRQRLLAVAETRRLREAGFERSLGRLHLGLLDLQSRTRDLVCRGESLDRPGPEILRRVRAGLPAVITITPIADPSVDDQYCLGVIWDETDACQLWWHSLDLSD
jgi:hypothetical protein